MSFKNRYIKISLPFITAILLGFLFVLFNGCSSDTPTSTTAPDTNVVSFDSVDIYPGTSTGLNIYLGKNADAGKDLVVVPTGITNGPPFYFQSGHLSGGSETGLTLADSTLSKSGYESISSVASWGTTIDSTIFLSHFSTQQWGTLSNPLTIFPVYGFYLQGKHSNGTTANKIYGIIHVNTVSGGGPEPYKINISIKYNKSGANKFN